jgi:hypothetical protein
MASAALILLPLGYVTMLALSADLAVWQRLWATRVHSVVGRSRSGNYPRVGRINGMDGHPI